jgi:hypothetical protein
MFTAKEIVVYHLGLGAATLGLLFFGAISDSAFSSEAGKARCEIRVPPTGALVDVRCGDHVERMSVGRLKDPVAVIRAGLVGAPTEIECTLSRGWVTQAISAKCT